MVNIDLLWYLLLPALFTVITIFVMHRFISGITWLQSSGAACGGLAIVALITTGIFYFGKGIKTHDTEIWNGEVLSKSRVHGSYIRTYSCNCYESCTGSGSNESCTQVCQTCYEDHYTVTWSCKSNIADFTIDGADWTSSSVYNLPDPARYTIIRRGDPVSVTNGYTNYIKAVPESLFRPAQAALKEKYKGQIPTYPIQIYDFYHINRVQAVGVNVPDLAYWNAKLSDVLKKLGPAKQANAVIVITKFSDPDYFYALQDAWVGGKKNDIVLVIGAPDYPSQAAWVRVMALTQDNIFQVMLRDEVLSLNKLTADNVIGMLEKETYATFKRKHMRDFKYLEAEIDPPTWLMVVLTLLITGAYGWFWYYTFHNRDAGSYGTFGTPRYRRLYR